MNVNSDEIVCRARLLFTLADLPAKAGLRRGCNTWLSTRRTTGALCVYNMYSIIYVYTLSILSMCTLCV